jgi:hypothetical protein
VVFALAAHWLACAESVKMMMTMMKHRNFFLLTSLGLASGFCWMLGGDGGGGGEGAGGTVQAHCSLAESSVG